MDRSSRKKMNKETKDFNDTLNHIDLIVFYKIPLFRHQALTDCHGLQHVRLPCLSPTPGVFPSSCQLSRWYYLTISSSPTPFSFCLQSFPASEFIPMSQLFASGVQNIGVSASASVLTMSIQSLFCMRLTGLIRLLSKGLLRVFSSTTVWKHQFFSTLPSLWFNFHICTWLYTSVERP